MAITASKTGNTTFEPMPAGVQQLVCVDVNDEGFHENPYKPGTAQHKISIAWQSAALREDGSRYLLTQWFTNSLHEKASLAQLVMDWLGVSYNEIPQNFDIEELIGKNARARIRQKEKRAGGMRAELQSIEPWEGEEIEPLGYDRRIDRNDYVPPSNEVQPASWYADGTMPAAPQTAQATPQAMPPQVATPQTARTAPASQTQVDAIMQEAMKTFGTSFLGKVAEYCRQVTRSNRGFSELDETEAAQVLNLLRSASATEAVTAKANGKRLTNTTTEAEPESDEYDDDDPFADDDPGGLTAAELNANGQAALVGSGAVNEYGSI